MQAFVAETLGRSDLLVTHQLLLLEVMQRAALESLPNSWVAAVGPALSSASGDVRSQAVHILQERRIAMFDETLRALMTGDGQTPELKVELANYNSDAQLVIAGHAKAVLSLCEELQKLSIRYVDLPVSAPFHSSLMKPAKLDMQSLLESSYFAKNSEGVIANINGAVVRDYGAQYLIDQIDGPVRWIQSIDTAKNEGMQRFIEVGPGKVLFGLVRRMVPRDGFEVLATDDIVEAVKALQ